MNYRQAKIVLRTLIILMILGVAFWTYQCVRTREITMIPETMTPKSMIHEAKSNGKVYDYNAQFADLNDAHLRYAKKIGISPIKTDRDIMTISRPIVEVTGGEDFYVSPLTHSYAYLVEPAAELLHDIGKEFNSKLRENGGGRYRINVTSLLRTAESVGRLKKGNVNSTENSAHLYGTTFDISYVKFDEDFTNTTKYKEEGLKMMLAEVLLKMKEQGRCLVKYERKQGCFHVTSTGK